MLPKVQPIYPDQVQNLRETNAVHKIRVNPYTGQMMAAGDIITDPFTGTAGYPYTKNC